jgi:hypothetical protein
MDPNNKNQPDMTYTLESMEKDEEQRKYQERDENE